MRTIWIPFPAAASPGMAGSYDFHPCGIPLRDPAAAYFRRDAGALHASRRQLWISLSCMRIMSASSAIR